MFAVAATAFTFSSLGMAMAQTDGSQFEPSSIRVEAGESIGLTAHVSRTDSGWAEDGPFFAYLSGDTFAETTTDTPLGKLGIDATEDTARVQLAITIPPQTPPGMYWVVVCNDPCTSTLGDLIGGVIFVGMDPPAEETTTGAVAVIASAGPTPTTHALALAPHPPRATGLSGAWVAISAGIAAAVLAAAVLDRSMSE